MNLTFLYLFEKQELEELRAKVGPDMGEREKYDVDFSNFDYLI